MASAPSTSAPSTSAFIDDSNESSMQKIMTQSVCACIEILKRRNIISNEVFDNLPAQAWILGNDMANTLFEVIEKYEATEDDELFTEEEHGVLENCSLDDSADLQNPELSQESVTSGSSYSISQPLLSSEYEPEEKKPKFETIDLEKKIKIVNLAREHPKWSLKTLKAHGASSLTRMDELKRWKKEIQQGGTRHDKNTAIKKQTYNRFCEARRNQIPVSTRNIQEWALQAAMQFDADDFSFIASLTWANRFKREFRIRQRKITRYVKSTEKKSLADIQKATQDFQNDYLNTISIFNPDYVLNTDQMGCEYRSQVQRTMEHVGQKTVEVHLGDLNRVTHTYTAQYTIAASGKLIPTVFLCLQEPKGIFGPRVGERVAALVADYKNIYVTCSKSGKLTSTLFDSYLTNVLQPYVKDNQFAFILDSWGGQSNTKLFDKFRNECGESSCTLQVIPPGCTPFCQPLDVYFHRQVKIFIKELQNCTHLLQEQRQINSREDAMKIHSLVANQLAAPIFRDMIEYAWYASRLIQTRKVFPNVKEVCFPEKPSKTLCKCSSRQSRTKSISFVKCSWCREYLCFVCFYEMYHPKQCTKFFINL